MKLLIVVLVLAISGAASAQTRTLTRQECHQGDIDIVNGEILEYVQSQWCINGSVFVLGQLMIGNEVMETLDLGNVRSISGVLVVSGNPRLKFLVSKLKRVEWVDLSSNPMLTECRAELFALRAGACNRWVAYHVNQGCGLLQWETEELEALQEDCID